VEVGELAAQTKLKKFLDGPVVNYSDDRNIPQINGTSLLSDHLAWGEISPNQCWNGTFPMVINGVQGSETFLKELVWRDFAYHLIYHTPHIVSKNWRQEWDAFPWRTDPNHSDVLAWKQGRTGIPFVDAAMREMYVTGRMHNRGRMIVASFLTKHLMTHWRIGLDWFSECLIDWDPASNAMGWQWSAGSGPDATPYFRVFNPVTQLQKFDPEGIYTKRWIAELSDNPSASSLAYFKAIPKHWKFDKESVYPSAITSPEEGRNRALEAYSTRGF
jgi:deoxyribodipyrimidine photo-lyase